MTIIEREQPRKITITPGINPYAHGSVIVEFGNTKVHVTAIVEEGVPSFMRDQGIGWVTAEYSMLPSSTHTRNRRERGKVGGRTMEIQRLIGRSLRAVIDFKKLGERTVMIDCDVLVADGGTRTASISGAYVAMSLACKRLQDEGLIPESPLKDSLGAISIGVNKAGKVIADLNYEEDSTCETDLNLVMTGSGRFVEIQGTAEGEPFTQEHLDALLTVGKISLKNVFAEQERVLK